MLFRERPYQRFPPPHYPRKSFSSVTKLNDDALLVKIVAERYYLAMAAASDVSARTIAELVVQLGCLTPPRGKTVRVGGLEWQRGARSLQGCRIYTAKSGRNLCAVKITNMAFVTPWTVLLRYSDVGKRRVVQIGKKKFQFRKFGHPWPAREIWRDNPCPDHLPATPKSQG